MEKQCINCKRKIDKGQAKCFVCGSQQQFFRYHFSTLLVFLILFSLMMATAFWYFEQQLQVIQQRNIDTNQLNTQTANIKIKQLENQLQSAKQEIQQMGKNTSQSSNVLVEEKQKTEKALAKAIEVEKRASWLSKENRQLKATIKQLKEQLVTASEVTTVPSQITPSQESNNLVEIDQLQKQKQAQLEQINLIESDLKQTWLEESNASGVIPDALTLSAREQQLSDATVIERQKILDIEQKIEVLQP